MKKGFTSRTQDNANKAVPDGEIPATNYRVH